MSENPSQLENITASAEKFAADVADNIVPQAQSPQKKKGGIGFKQVAGGTAAGIAVGTWDYMRRNSKLVLKKFTDITGLGVSDGTVDGAVASLTKIGNYANRHGTDEIAIVTEGFKNFDAVVGKIRIDPKLIHSPEALSNVVKIYGRDGVSLPNNAQQASVILDNMTDMNALKSIPKKIKSIFTGFLDSAEAYTMIGVENPITEASKDSVKEAIKAAATPPAATLEVFAKQSTQTIVDTERSTSAETVKKLANKAYEKGQIALDKVEKAPNAVKAIIGGVVVATTVIAASQFLKKRKERAEERGYRGMRELELETEKLNLAIQQNGHSR